MGWGQIVDKDFLFLIWKFFRPSKYPIWFENTSKFCELESEVVWTETYATLPNWPAWQVTSPTSITIIILCYTRPRKLMDDIITKPLLSPPVKLPKNQWPFFEERKNFRSQNIMWICFRLYTHSALKLEKKVQLKEIHISLWLPKVNVFFFKQRAEWI